MKKFEVKCTEGGAIVREVIRADQVELVEFCSEKYLRFTRAGDVVACFFSFDAYKELHE